MTPRQHGMLIALSAGMDSVLKWWAVMTQLNHGFLVRLAREPGKRIGRVTALRDRQDSLGRENRPWLTAGAKAAVPPTEGGRHRSLN